MRYNKVVNNGGVFVDNIGKMLAEIRENKGISQRELARRMDIDHAYISRIEKGVINPNIKYLQKIEKVLQVGINLTIQNEKEILENIELTNYDHINEYNLTVDGKRLSQKEIKLIVNLIRSLRE